MHGYTAGYNARLQWKVNNTPLQCTVTMKGKQRMVTMHGYKDVQQYFSSDEKERTQIIFSGISRFIFNSLHSYIFAPSAVKSRATSSKI